MVFLSHPAGDKVEANSCAMQAEVALLLGRGIKVTKTQLEILVHLERHQHHAPLLAQPGSLYLLMVTENQRNSSVQEVPELGILTCGHSWLSTPMSLSSAALGIPTCGHSWLSTPYSISRGTRPTTSEIRLSPDTAVWQLPSICSLCDAKGREGGCVHSICPHSCLKWGVMGTGGCFAAGHLRAQASPGPQPSNPTLSSASAVKSRAVPRLPRPRPDCVANTFHTKRRIWFSPPSLERIGGNET